MKERISYEMPHGAFPLSEMNLAEQTTTITIMARVACNIIRNSSQPLTFEEVQQEIANQTDSSLSDSVYGIQHGIHQGTIEEQGDYMVAHQAESK